MNDGLIPQRYAKALYKYALEKADDTQLYEEMKRVADAFAARPDLQKVMDNPYVGAPDKERLLLAAAGEIPSDAYKAFVRLVLSHDREGFMRRIALAYRGIYRDAHHIAQVVITTAAPLPDAEMQKLQGIVRKAFPEATLEVSCQVNPELIGGFVIDVDSTRMDASISNEIEQIRQNLLRRN